MYGPYRSVNILLPAKKIKQTPGVTMFFTADFRGFFTAGTDEQKAAYLSDLFSNVYIKDVVDRNHLKEDSILGPLVNILASAVGSLTNPARLTGAFVSAGIKTSDKTVISYIKFLEDAFIIEKAERFDVKGKKYINSKRKYYFTDVGLRNARLNFRQQEQTHLMENILFNELLFRGYSVDVGIVEKHIKDSAGTQKNVQLEIDFVCNKGSQRYYIQSAYSIPDSEKMQQETAVLDRTGDSFKKIIVTQDNIKPWHTEKGYLVINVLDFLLDERSLEL